MLKPIFIAVTYNTAITVSIITIPAKFEFVLLCFMYSLRLVIFKFSMFPMFLLL
jgi:hypothetical protein